MSGTAADVIRIAKSQVGYHEGYSGGHWNNYQKYSPEVPGLEWSQNQAWCATFVSWCFLEAGMPTGSYPVTASVATARDWWKQHGRFSEYPAIGAQCIMGVSGTAHTGLVYAYDSTYIYTVEGNTNSTGSAEGDGVYLKKRSRRDSYVYGYGYPAYPGGIVSADPSYKKPATPSTKPPAPATRPKVSLAHVVYAARHDPAAAQGHTSHRAEVLLIEKALHAEGLLDSQWIDGSWGTKTIGAYSSWQRRLGYTGSDADGIPGKTSLQRLGDKHGFSVTS